jgi:hypothetical protein
VGKETSQRLGYEGVHEIKEWLEATTRFAFTYTVYDNEPMCTVTCLNNETKALDLEGVTKPADGTAGTPVSVECKKYSTPGGQTQEYRKFLAIAYSSTVRIINVVGQDCGREFMWVTYHPFAQTDWKKLLTVKYMRKCIEDHGALLEGAVIDDDLLAIVASRVWVMVVQQRQVNIRLDKVELSKVHTALLQGGK